MKFSQWNIATPESAATARLEAAGVSPLAARVLCARGVTSAARAADFFAAGEQPLPDPFLLKDMDKAVLRLSLALEKGEQICVFGDYDADGITSTCLLTHFLTARGGKIAPYIPDRLDEGYGLSCEALGALKARGISLVVTVDCGITAETEAQYALALGIDLIITDHHTCKAALPVAVAAVDPHRADCPYPFKGLAGVGVALMLVLALTAENERAQVFGDYADLAAIGTVADVMPLTGENRRIVTQGLAAMERAPRLGIAALVRAAGAEGKPITAMSIGFTLGPRMNAAGRMGHAPVCAELLLTGDAARADELAETLCALNRERQAVELDIFEACVEQLGRDGETNRRAIVLAGEGWHQGVVGIVASRLTEKYACPAFVICMQEGRGKGSCRSFGGFNLFEGLTACAPLLQGFGGHAQAAGFSILEEDIPAFRAQMVAMVDAWSGGAPLVSSLQIDCALPDASLLTLPEIAGLDALEPCGAGNSKPLFLLSGCTVAALSHVGGGKHLKLRLEHTGTTLAAIFFSATAETTGLAVGAHIDVAFSPQINDYRGLSSPQLQITDLRLARTHAELEQELYRRLCLGETLAPREAEALTPTREDCAAVWRYLRQRGGHAEDGERQFAHCVAKAFGTRESTARTRICLDALEQQGLLSLSCTGGHLKIACLPAEQKVNLEDAPILRRLSALSQKSGAIL